MAYDKYGSRMFNDAHRINNSLVRVLMSMDPEMRALVKEAVLKSIQAVDVEAPAEGNDSWYGHS